MSDAAARAVALCSTMPHFCRSVATINSLFTGALAIAAAATALERWAFWALALPLLPV
jgi:hypothetical protein